MISFLTDALERASVVDLAVSELRLPALTRYRSAAFRLMRALSADDLVEDFTEDRILVGRHVSGTLRLPENWGEEWLQRIAGGEGTDQFVRRLRRETDEHIGELAATFIGAAEHLRNATSGLNPMRLRCRELLDEFAGRSFLVLLQRPYQRCRQLYTSLDSRFAETSLCTEADLRRLDRFVDVYITTGRFDRFTPDHVLTAPRSCSIVNVRWHGDADDREDFPLFPCLRLKQIAGAKGDVTNSVPRAPVMVSRSVQLIDRTPPATTGQPGVCDGADDNGEWDAITFDEWYLGKRQRLRGQGSRQTERPASYSGLAVYVGTADGGGLFVPINEEGKARSLLAFDPFENVVAMRRPALDPDAQGDRGEHLEEGMMLVLPGEAVETDDQMGAGLRLLTAGERFNLKSSWKRELAAHITRDGAAGVASRLDSLGVSLGDLTSSVQRWAREDGINAPRSEEHFRALVRDVLKVRDQDPQREQQYPWWVRAWDAILYERSLNISLGLLEESARERAVKSAIQAHMGLIIDAARGSAGVTIPVGNGEGNVRVVTVEFIDGGQDGRRFQVAEEECLQYMEPHEARLRWLR